MLHSCTWNLTFPVNPRPSSEDDVGPHRRKTGSLAGILCGAWEEFPLREPIAEAWDEETGHTEPETELEGCLADRLNQKDSAQ